MVVSLTSERIKELVEVEGRDNYSGVWVEVK